jgi:hypothetical protein
MAALRDRIAEMLEPPVISSLSISPGDPLIRGRNWADISWQAHHPGSVAETSYLIRSAGTGDGQFTSARQACIIKALYLEHSCYYRNC